MFPRLLLSHLRDLLTRYPAVELLGPRQIGKTTLALELGKERASLYLDLEAPSDAAKLAEPELFLERHEDKLVILDEIQRAPGIFQMLRGIIGRGRRRGKGTGKFLVPGSAGLDPLLEQSSKSLAGRIAYTESSANAASPLLPPAASTKAAKTSSRSRNFSST